MLYFSGLWFAMLYYNVESSRIPGIDLKRALTPSLSHPMGEGGRRPGEGSGVGVKGSRGSREEETLTPSLSHPMGEGG